MRLGKHMVGVAAAVLFLASPAFASYDEYDDYYDAHPLRIVAYAVNPAGYTLEWLVTRPLHVLVSQPGLQAIFGYTPSEFDFRSQEMPPAGPVTVAPPAAAAPPAVSAADVEAARRAAEEARAAAEEARRAAEEAAQAADKATRAFEKGLRK